MLHDKNIQTNSRVKHKSENPKDNFNSNNYSDKNSFNNCGNNNNNPLDNENNARQVNNTRNTTVLHGDSIAKNLNRYLSTKKITKQETYLS